MTSKSSADSVRRKPFALRRSSRRPGPHLARAPRRSAPRFDGPSPHFLDPRPGFPARIGRCLRSVAAAAPGPGPRSPTLRLPCQYALWSCPQPPSWSPTVYYLVADEAASAGAARAARGVRRAARRPRPEPRPVADPGRADRLPAPRRPLWTSAELSICTPISSGRTDGSRRPPPSTGRIRSRRAIRSGRRRSSSGWRPPGRTWSGAVGVVETTEWSAIQFQILHALEAGRRWDWLLQNDLCSRRPDPPPRVRPIRRRWTWSWRGFRTR